MRYEIKPEDLPISPRFLLGVVKVDTTNDILSVKEFVFHALRRHCNCDFGAVTFEHHCGNLEIISQQEGVITSEYPSPDIKISVVTRLDDFDPTTLIYVD
jgi:hypothetical protein